MGQTIELLENALRAWEDIFLLDEAHMRTCLQTGLRQAKDLVGPIKHWRELRNHLLLLKGNDFDLPRFCFGEDEERPVGVFQVADRRAYETLPLQLASWTLSSRRTFQISATLAEKFVAADYSNYRWSDLLWPFDAFVVSLEAPVESNVYKGGKFSALLVSSIFGVCNDHFLASKSGFECRPFIIEVSGAARPPSILSEKDRARVDDDLRHKRWRKLNKRVTRLYTDFWGKGEMLGDGNMSISVSAVPSGVFEAPYAGEKDEPIGDTAEAKILAGLCLYLEALPAGTVDAYQWHHTQQVRAKRDVRKIITDGEQVCRVEDFHTLSPETMSLFPETLKQGPAYTVTPHWRRAHYRRKKGQGNNPNAPRDVLVRPALIHKDQLPEGAVPGGAKSSVR